MQVSKFSCDNNVVFKFLADKCFMKSQVSKLTFILSLRESMDYIAFHAWLWSLQGCPLCLVPKFFLFAPMLSLFHALCYLV